MRVDSGAAEDVFHTVRFLDLLHLRRVPLGGAQGGCGFLDPHRSAGLVVARPVPYLQQMLAGLFDGFEIRLDVVERLIRLPQADQGGLVVLRAELDRGQLAGHGGILVAKYRSCDRPLIFMSQNS